MFLAAVIKAVDDYQDLLRLSVATAGNDHRLGANEAPPAIISIFLGDELTAVLDAIVADAPYLAAEKTQIKLGVHSLPRIARDTTDRNRTSPFAFTGNKFEFRSLGSANSIAYTNIMLNAAVAQTLKEFADQLEQVEDKNAALHDLIRDTVKAHKRIIFNGNGYDEEWVKEATEVRGLLNLRTTPDCMPMLLAKKNVDMLTEQGVFSETELESRYEIILENYCKIINIEALTMADMARREILPAILSYVNEIAATAAKKKALSDDISCGYEKKLVSKLSYLIDQIEDKTDALECAMAKLHTISDVTEEANTIRDEILPKMSTLRASADEAETLTAEKYWPFPTYGELLFGVR
jgi:glutamine synthetase